MTKTTNTLKLVGNLEFFQAYRDRMAKSLARTAKTNNVITWKERPASATLTPVVDPPLDVDDMAPPMAWRIKLIRSQGMKP